MVFARGEGSSAAAPAPTPAAPLRAAPDALARADSLEHLRPLSALTDDEPGKFLRTFPQLDLFGHGDIVMSKC